MKRKLVRLGLTGDKDSNEGVASVSLPDSIDLLLREPLPQRRAEPRLHLVRLWMTDET